MFSIIRLFLANLAIRRLERAIVAAEVYVNLRSLNRGNR